MTDIPEDVMQAARKISAADGGEENCHLEYMIARAILAERSAAKRRIEELEAGLRNLSQEMSHMLRTNPSKDGGLYRQRLDEALALLREGQEQ